jgi:hypothetical protein
MTRLITTCISLFLWTASVFAQTPIAAGSQVAGQWKRSGSPYQIQGEVTIPEGMSLHIEKGVEVQFKTWDGGTHVSETEAGWLRIQGRLLADGTENDRIVFTRIGSEGSWGLLFFDSLSTGNILDHCVVQYAGSIDEIRGDYQTYGGVSAYKSNILIKNTVLTGTTAYAVVCGRGSNVAIENCLIAGNFGAGIGCFDAGPQIEKTTITDNVQAGVYGYRDAEPHLKRCVLVGNAPALHSDAAILDKCITDMRPMGRSVRMEDTDLVQPAPAHLQWVMGVETLAPLSEWAGRGIGCSFLKDMASRGKLAVFLR